MLKIKKKRGTLRGLEGDTGTGGHWGGHWGMQGRGGGHKGGTLGTPRGQHGGGGGHEGTQGRGGDIGDTPSVPTQPGLGERERKFQEIFLPWEAPDPP